MFLDLLARFAGGRIPYPNSPVVRAGDDPIAIARYRHGRDRAIVFPGVSRIFRVSMSQTRATLSLEPVMKRSPSLVTTTAFTISGKAKVCSERVRTFQICPLLF